MSGRPYVVFIMGPTAAGKTALALHLHARMDSEIISVDSAQIYRGLDIGTGKPGPALRRAAPHHLLDICDPAETYSAARFRGAAYALVMDIIERGRTPLLTGGTGLYFRALEQGLAELPAADYRLRARLLDEARQYGWPALHARLKALDPASAARIAAHDPQRIQRALEVHELSGEPLSALLAAGRKQPFPLPIKKIVLSPPRPLLHLRIARRFAAMLGEGLIEETRELCRRADLAPHLPSMRLVGYRQVRHYLAGQLDYAGMRERALIATRQLAKRQLTWCRGEREADWFDPAEAGIYREIMKKLDKST